jgi:nicotinamidase-related amidase
MNNTEYFEFLERWKNNLLTLKAEKVFSIPKKTAIASVDLVNGFCKNGGFLYSKRCENVINPNANLFKLASYQHNVHDFFMVFDSHDEGAVEFMSFPEHCVKGSDETRHVEKVVEPLSSSWMHWIPKNSIAPNKNFPLNLIKNFKTFIVTGVCTDICVYQLATFIKMYYNENNIMTRVIVPENCVNTYDSEDHPGDLYHLMFLYNMYINGIEIVKGIE